MSGGIRSTTTRTRVLAHWCASTRAEIRSASSGHLTDDYPGRGKEPPNRACALARKRQGGRGPTGLLPPEPAPCAQVFQHPGQLLQLLCFQGCPTGTSKKYNPDISLILSEKHNLCFRAAPIEAGNLMRFTFLRSRIAAFGGSCEAASSKVCFAHFQ